MVMLRIVMAKLTPQQQAEIQTLLPSVISWAERKEREALNNGVPLNDLLKNTAMVLGIKQISSVRIRAVDVIPKPDIPRIVQLAQEFGLSFAQSAGMTFGHAIYARHSHSQDSHLLTHELIHVRQYEQAGSVAAYLHEYVKQLGEFGYQNMPLEQEAVVEAFRLLGPPQRS
jgi:hypothetical protein